jgi:hypothetical protein
MSPPDKPSEPGAQVTLEAKPKKPLSPAAERALAEAAARRAEREDSVAARPKEFPERDGPDPARYGDWEKKGIASDF